MNNDQPLPDTDADKTLDVLISAIEHYSYCPRQCGLIHIEQSYADNRFTIRGDIAHERVDSGVTAPTSGAVVYRSISLWSVTYGLRGKSDVVELRADGPHPVEYKVGGWRRDEHASLQLCAQALCLEDMFETSVHSGAIYSHTLRRRTEVTFDDHLRAKTIAVIATIRAMLDAQELPQPCNDARCRNCSLIDICLPEIVVNPQRIRGLHSALYQITNVRDMDE